MTRNVSVNLSENDTPITTATVTLSDASATYGIREADTDTVVVAAGTSVPHIAAGVYTYAFADAEPGVAYEATIKVVWPDGSIDYVDRPLDASPIGEVGIDGLAGRFFTGSGIKSQLGTINTIVYSDLENASEDSPDLARIQTDGETADAYTEHRARNGGKPRATPIESTDGDFALIRLATNMYAAYLLSAHRVSFGEGEDDTSRRILGLRKRAMELYDELFGGVSSTAAGAVKPGTFQTVPMIFEPECASDEFSG